MMRNSFKKWENFEQDNGHVKARYAKNGRPIKGLPPSVSHGESSESGEQYQEGGYFGSKANLDESMISGDRGEMNGLRGTENPEENTTRSKMEEIRGGVNPDKRKIQR